MDEIDKGHHHKCEWNNPAERAAFIREQLREQRLAWLDLLVPTRVCPSCGQIKTSSRSWCIFKVDLLPDHMSELLRFSKRGEMCLCRSCTSLKVPKAWGRGGSRTRLSNKNVIDK
jgi:hypothetical protein